MKTRQIGSLLGPRQVRSHRVSPRTAERLAPLGFVVVGDAPSAEYVHSMYCCLSCSPHAPTRTTEEAARVFIRRPDSMSYKSARKMISMVIYGVKDAT